MKMDAYEQIWFRSVGREDFFSETGRPLLQSVIRAIPSSTFISRSRWSSGETYT